MASELVNPVPERILLPSSTPTPEEISETEKPEARQKAESTDEFELSIDSIRFLESLETRSGTLANGPDKKIVEKYRYAPSLDIPPIPIALSPDPAIDGLALGGLHRREASRSRGDKTIRVRHVCVETMADALKEAVLDNLRHGKHLSPQDLVHCAHRLRDAGLNNVEIGKIFGKNKSTIGRWLKKSEDSASGSKSCTMQLPIKKAKNTLSWLEQLLEKGDTYGEALPGAIQGVQKLVKVLENQNSSSNKRQS